MTQQLPIAFPDAARIAPARPRPLAGPSAGPAPAQPLRQRYDARRMTGHFGTAEIVLDDKVYTLRITRAGKLILTK